MNRPDKPINSWLRQARRILRWTRLAFWRLRLIGKIKVGRNVFLGRNCYLAPSSYLSIGDNVAIGSSFYLESNLKVGNDVLISSHVSMVGNDHRFDSPDFTVFWAGRLPPSAVVLEGDNLIGHRVVIVGSVHIGYGCIVGAGSVVTRDLPSNMICYGVPAKPMRHRFKLKTDN
ncbi:acyltransferase [Polynucleobacter sinensis]|uniref:acyltransferase n=1 Tax=Polynucleobacter sinensis TaxID=1743157 RepID=UPI000783CA2D